jgi:fructosamine-3-kinase
MDIWAQNILVNEHGQITAILDWDRALWGDPEIEFAVLDYCGFNHDGFWDGYGTKPEHTPEFLIRQKFYHLYEVQKYLVIWQLRRPERSGDIAHYKKYCLELIDQLQFPFIDGDNL